MRCSQLALAIFVAGAVIQGAALPMAAADDWRTYRNERYGTTIDYPDFFKAGPPPANNDGLAFKSDDGAAFSVFASFNALDFDLAGFKDFIVKNLEAGEVITYQAQGKDWFVISGTKGRRHILRAASTVPRQTDDRRLRHVVSVEPEAEIRSDRRADVEVVSLR
jgi:hypothetical protein